MYLIAGNIEVFRISGIIFLTRSGLIKFGEKLIFGNRNPNF